MLDTVERRFRRFAAGLALAGLLTIGIPAHGASDVYVQQDHTPIVTKPGIGGKILVWVDAGFPLTVHGRDGDWLKVSSSLLEVPGHSLWVPAARVDDILPGAFDIAYAPDRSPAARDGTLFRLEVSGSPDLRVRAQCRADKGGDDAFHRVIDDVPVTLDIDAAAVDCFVRKLESPGRIDAVLRAADGTIIATAGTFARRGAVRVRSNGPWGGAAGFALPTRFVVEEDTATMNPPTGGLVPPLGNPVPAPGNPTPPLAAPLATQ
jgi:hypothetical protein